MKENTDVLFFHAEIDAIPIRFAYASISQLRKIPFVIFLRGGKYGSLRIEKEKTVFI